MARLIWANLIRYFKSPLLLATLVCSLILGSIGGIKAWQYIHMDYDYYVGSVWLISPLSRIWIEYVIWVLVVLIALMVGIEFSDGTIRNKLCVGRTKAAVYLAEIVAAFVVTCCVFFAMLIPIMIGGHTFFAILPQSVFLRMSMTLLLFFMVWSVLAVTISLLTANRAVGVVAVFSVMLILAIVNINLRGFYENTGPAEVTMNEIVFTEDGQPYSAERISKNHWYLPPIPKAFVNAEFEANPFTRLYHVCDYAYLHHPEQAETDAVYEMQKDLDLRLLYDCIILLVTGAVIAAIGLVWFQRRNLK